jgi:hypothetical protein
MINKNLIRKIILEELIRKIDQRKPLNEVAPLLIAAGAAVVGAAGVAALNAFTTSDKAEKVRSVTNANPQNNIYSRFEKFIDELQNVVLPNDQEALAIATELADATIYYTQGLGAGTIGRLTADLGPLGAGTNEEGVQEAIVKSKSKIGLAKVSLAFNQKFNKVFYDVFNDEFSGTAADQYVIEPIIDLPFIIIENEDGEEIPLTEEEFLAELEKAKAAAKEGEKSDVGVPSMDLGFGLDRPYVLNIIKTMNTYAKNKKLEGYAPAPEEDKWSPAVQDCWLKFAPHALNNCNLYNTEFTPEKIGDIASWPNMSFKMKSKYPGYTPNPRGCLAFCLDAYYCELKYGNQAPAAPSGRGNGGGSGRSPEEKRPSESKETSSKKITVELAQTGESFKGSGFTLEGSGDPDKLMIEAILNEMSPESKRAGYPGGILTFFFVIKGDRISDVRIERGGGQNAGLNYPYRNLLRTFEDIGNRLIFPVGENKPYSKNGGSFDNPKGLGGKGIKVTFNIPAGNIKDLRP